MSDNKKLDAGDKCIYNNEVYYIEAIYREEDTNILYAEIISISKNKQLMIELNKLKKI